MVDSNEVNPAKNSHFVAKQPIPNFFSAVKFPDSAKDRLEVKADIEPSRSHRRLLAGCCRSASLG